MATKDAGQTSSVARNTAAKVYSKARINIPNYALVRNCL